MSKSFPSKWLLIVLISLRTLFAFGQEEYIYSDHPTNYLPPDKPYKALAKPLVIRDDGYSPDRRFHRIIKSRKYRLVGIFDTIKKDTLTMYARVITDFGIRVIDQFGREMLPIYSSVNLKQLEVTEIMDSQRMIVFNEDFEVVTNNEKAGIRNKKTNREVVPPIYDQARISVFGFYVVKKNGMWGIIDKGGNLIVPCRYDEIKPLRMSRGGFTSLAGHAEVVRSGKLWGLLSEAGRIIIQPEYNEIRSSWVSSVLIVKKDANYALMNKKGEALTEFAYGNFHDFDSYGLTPMLNKGTGNHGLLDSLGNEVLKAIYHGVYRVNEGFYLTVINTERPPLYGIYNAKTNHLSDHIYSSIEYVRHGPFIVSSFGLFGMLDTTGQVMVQPAYQSMEPFNKRQMFIVKADNKYGMMDSRGNTLLKPIYDELHYRNENTVLATLGDKKGAFDAAGNLLIPFQYDYLDTTGTKEIFIYRNHSKWGLAGTKGIITKHLYQQINDLRDGFFCIRKDDKYGIMNENGYIIVKPKYMLPITNISSPGLEKVRGFFEIKRMKGGSNLIDLYGNIYD